MEKSIYDTLYSNSEDLKLKKIALGDINGQPYPVTTIIMQRLLLSVEPNENVRIHRSSNDCILTECKITNGNSCKFQTDFETFFTLEDQGCVCAPDYEGTLCEMEVGYAVGVILGVVFGVIFVSVIFVKWGWPFLMTVFGKRKKRIAQD